MTFRGGATAALLGILLAGRGGDLAGQVDSAIVTRTEAYSGPAAGPIDTPATVAAWLRSGAEFRIRLASLLAPGLGQD